MILIKAPNKVIKKISKSPGGFTLIETSAALVILGVIIAWAMPLFLYSRIKNAKSEIKNGSLIVAKKVFDNVRSQKISALPSNPAVPQQITNPDVLRVMGRDYTAQVVYCDNVTNFASVCNSSTRQIKVEVKYNGEEVYNLEGIVAETIE